MKWFSKKEEEIAEFYFNDFRKYQEQDLNMLDTQLKKVIPSAALELGGDYQITISPDGIRSKFFLTEYLVKNAPKDLKYNWKFHGFRMASNINFEFRMNDVTVSAQEVMVQTEYDSSANLFHLSFYEQTLSKLDDNNAISLFYLLLDNSIGENYTTIYAGRLENSKSPLANGIPLNNLKQHIEETLSNAEKNIVADVCQVTTAYELQPQESNEMRKDIFFGFTNTISLVQEYYAKEDETYQMYVTHGIKPAFLSFFCDMDLKDAVAKRTEIADRIQCIPYGALIGEAVGAGVLYIDLLLYDKDKFLEEATTILREFPFDFYISDFNTKDTNTRAIK